MSRSRRVERADDPIATTREGDGERDREGDGGKDLGERSEKAPVADEGLLSVPILSGQLSNSPSFTPPTKASHSERVKNSFGPSGSLESRNT